MSAAFNIHQDWLEGGGSCFDESFSQNYPRLQERYLCDVLRAGKIPMGRVLELGCGTGRITRVLGKRFPSAQIQALDVNTDRLARARRVCAGLRNITFTRQDFCSKDPLPGSDYDTTVAVEVFQRQPAEVVLELFRRLCKTARFIVHIDWSENWRWATPEDVWVHDYRKLYGQAGLKCAAFTLPEKVDGLQQQLLVGGRELTSEVLALESASQRTQRHDAAVAQLIPAAASGAQWLRQLYAASQDIQSVVPRSSTLILVDDSTWGNAQRLLPGRRVLPFLEKNGEYWGPPPDDATAISELERMRSAGARYLAVAWNSSWWLQHYRGFHQHLRQRGRCVLMSDDVMVFEL
jgi:SAM-dependent methyltransferase